VYAGKRVLVTGGTGLIGRPLVRMLIERGAEVRIASLDDPSRAHPQAEFLRVNLMQWENCVRACEGMDYVFHVAGIKGSPAMTAKKPASFFVPTMTFNLNMMEAARQSGVQKYLFTSTVGVYSPAEVFHEDEVWKTFPSPNDWFAGWAKRMGELQADAYRIEYGWDQVAIVRPGNVYGPYDNFDPRNATVMGSLIGRAMSGENPFVVWGDGTPLRDFIFTDDCARGMLLAMERMIGKPINLGSGVGVRIKDVVDIIVRHLDTKPEVVFDTTKPSGDRKRVLDMTRASEIGFAPQVPLEDGIVQTMQWYREHRHEVDQRYNVFTEPAFYTT
jgi:GDP-L-fucose synthase